MALDLYDLIDLGTALSWTGALTPLRASSAWQPISG
jgi:hypothetical protein